jgi:hypothetical protein
MSPRTLTIFGLTSDMVGGLLLSVAAVELKNLAAVRDAGAGLARRLSTMYASLRESSKTPESPEGSGPPVFMWIHLNLFLVVVVLGATQISLLPTYAEVLVWVPTAVLLASLGFFVLAGWSLLFLAVVMLALSLLVGALGVLERHTPTGGVGMIGAVFLLGGFVLQLVGATGTE